MIARSIGVVDGWMSRRLLLMDFLLMSSVVQQIQAMMRYTGLLIARCGMTCRDWRKTSPGGLYARASTNRCGGDELRDE